VPKKKKKKKMLKKEEELDPFKLKIISLLTTKYGLSMNYVAACVKGERKNQIGDFIYKDYLKLRESVKR
jgi:predicted ATP-dependent Lon-type protease